MDPISVLTIVSAAVQFVDFGYKVTSTALEIHRSADGSTKQNLDIEVTTSSLKMLVDRLRRPVPQDPLTAEEEDIMKLSSDCEDVANELLGALQNIKVNQTDGRLRSFAKVLKSVWKKAQVEAIVWRLDAFRNQINLSITVSLRQKLDLLALQQSQGFRNLDTLSQDIIQCLRAGQKLFTKTLDEQSAQLLSGIAAIQAEVKSNSDSVTSITARTALLKLSSLSGRNPEDVLTELRHMAEKLNRRLGEAQVSRRMLAKAKKDLSYLSKEDDVNARSTALFKKDDHVIVEWKSVNPQLNAAAAGEILYRVEDIARLLRHEGKPMEMRTLDCVGYITQFEKQEPRYGILYKVPTEGSMRSLAQLVGELKPAPCSVERGKLALRISKAVLMLHLSFWYHKGIRSHNIVFFASELLRVELDEPFIIGFEFSRADVADAMTEIPGASTEFNLYRHPECQGLPVEEVNNAQSNRPPYCKRFDVYSLGAVLLEIGLWSSLGHVKAAALQNADYTSDTPTQFQQWLIDRIVPELEASMGTAYMESVRECLRGILFEDEDRAVAALYTDVIVQLESMTVGKEGKAGGGGNQEGAEKELKQKEEEHEKAEEKEREDGK